MINTVRPTNIDVKSFTWKQIKKEPEKQWYILDKPGYLVFSTIKKEVEDYIINNHVEHPYAISEYYGVLGIRI